MSGLRPMPSALFALFLTLGSLSNSQAHAQQPLGNRYDIAKGSLSVDLSASYPPGYSPSWTINGAQAQAITTNRYNILLHGPQGTETLFVRFTEDQGHTVFEFARRGTNPLRRRHYWLT